MDKGPSAAAAASAKRSAANGASWRKRKAIQPAWKAAST